MSTPVTVIFGQLPAGFCPSTPQELVNKLNEIVSAFTDMTVTGIVVSEAKPGPDDRDKVWLEVDANNVPIGLWYYDDGDWIWPHHTYYWASSDVRLLWVGTENALETFDGGEGGVGPSATTGPFWEADDDYGDRLLLGVKTGGTYTVGTDAPIITTGANNPQARGIFVIKRTMRTHLRHA